MASLRDQGIPTWLAEQIYSPFIVGGPATWSDSWGAPRYGPGSVIRSHEGQDVLCELGDPVLAAAVGEVHFDVGLLGGLSVTVYEPEGGALYYAHLSGWNPELAEGDLVVPGQVLGFCGETGNATVPHVHFGLFHADGSPLDPMPFLVESLKAAEFEFFALHDGSGGRFRPEPEATSRLYSQDGFLRKLLQGWKEGSGEVSQIGFRVQSSSQDRRNHAGLAVLFAFVIVSMIVAARIWLIRLRSDSTQ